MLCQIPNPYCPNPTLCSPRNREVVEVGGGHGVVPRIDDVQAHLVHREGLSKGTRQVPIEAAVSAVL